MDDLYKMKLHETLTPAGDQPVSILRVPGGWIYTTYSSSGPDGHDVSSVFVSLHTEFQHSRSGDLDF